MDFRDLTRDSVVKATQEFDAIGREEFLRRYGFHPSREYFLVLNERQYDSKAIVGVAHGAARPDVGTLKASEFSGGEKRVAAVLERLGFTVVRLAVPRPASPDLIAGQVYSWEELGALFGFKAELFSVAGGMISRPALNTTILITHPNGARSFDYEDRWDGDTLIYTGRGKTGDQQLKGPNQDVAENRRRLLVFEGEATRQLRYLGEARCLDK